MTYRNAAYVLVLLLGFTSQVAAGAPSSLGAKGTWSSDDGDLTGSWQATFVVEEYSAEGSIQQIGGDITIKGMEGISGGKVSGNIKPGIIQFGILYGKEELATFSGTVVRGGQLMGTYSRPDGTNGTWKGGWTHSAKGEEGSAPAVPKADAPKAEAPVESSE